MVNFANKSDKINCMLNKNDAHLKIVKHLSIVWYTLDGDWQLLLIKGQRSVGTINEDHEVYCINNIAVLPLTKNGHPEIEIEVRFFFRSSIPSCVTSQNCPFCPFKSGL